jgi:hypothetical protein
VTASASGQVDLQRCSQQFGIHFVKPLMLPNIFLPKLFDSAHF